MSFETVKFNEMIQFMENSNVILVDVREEWEYKKGHIENAVNIPYENIERCLSMLNAYEKIVLYCDRGNLSLRAAKDLYNRGYSVVNLAGGLHAYRGKLVK